MKKQTLFICLSLLSIQTTYSMQEQEIRTLESLSSHDKDDNIIDMEFEFLRNKNDFDKLLEAAKAGNVTLTKKLMDRDALKRDAILYFVLNPLENNEKIFTTFLKAGLDINESAFIGYNALQWSIRKDDIEKVEWLLSNGFNLSKVDAHNKTIREFLEEYFVGKYGKEDIQRWLKIIYKGAHI